MGLTENIKLGAVFATLPFVFATRLLQSTYSLEKDKTWRRVVFDAFFRAITNTASIPTIKGIQGTSDTAYQAWAKKAKEEIRIDELEDAEGARIFWAGPKQVDKVILFLHGGGFHLPLALDMIEFWEHVRGELGKGGIEVGIAMLDFSLIPEAHFPTQLIQAVAAIEFLLKNGTELSNLILAGDSAGANLVMQVLLHAVHPVPSVPVLSNPKFGAAYLMSPFLDLLPARTPSTAQCYTDNAKWDVINPEKLAVLGQGILDGIKDPKYLPYVDQFAAPEGWYGGISDTVKEVLFTVGNGECLRDDILLFAKKLEKENPKIKLDVVLDKCGVHCDPFHDFFAGESRHGELYDVVIAWFKKVITTS